MKPQDLADLTPAELDKLEAILSQLPPTKLLDEIAWEEIGRAVRSPDTETVGSMLAAIDRRRRARGIRDELLRKLEGMGEVLRDHTPSPHQCGCACVGCHPPAATSDAQYRQDLREWEAELAERRARGDVDPLLEHERNRLELAKTIASLDVPDTDTNDEHTPRRRRTRNA